MRTTNVKLSEILSEKNLNLDAKYWVNKKSGRDPYVRKGFKYVKARTGTSEMTRARYFSARQVEEINFNLEILRITEQKIKVLEDGN